MTNETHSSAGHGRSRKAPVLSSPEGKWDLDNLRDAFRRTFDEYTREGSRMKELLISLEESTESERLHAINEQQLKLTDARQRYEHARSRYVSYVLGGFTGAGGATL